MSLHIVPYYAAILALIFIALSASVIKGRSRHAVILGSGAILDLERRIRVHANFAEYVPFTLLLLSMAEWRGQAAGVLHMLCLCLLAGRLLHAWGVSQVVENLRFRMAGMVLTLTALGGSGLAIVAS
jgi:uncharacterized membrane protein YecN with MAPEG domain